MKLPRAAVGCALTLALLPGLAACGSDTRQLTPADHQAIAQITTAFSANGGLSRRDAHCVATGWVRSLSAQRMVRAGVLTKGSYAMARSSKRPTRPVLQAYADAYFACVNYGKMEARRLSQQRRIKIDEGRFARCANRIDQSQAKRALVDDLMGRRTTTSAEVTHRLLQCAGL